MIQIKDERELKADVTADMNRPRYQTILTVLDDPIQIAEGPIFFPMNPRPVKIRTVAEWTPTNVNGATRDGAKWIKNPPRVIQFTMLLSNHIFAPNQPGGRATRLLQDFIDRLERITSDPTVTTQEPTRLLLSMGEGNYNVVLRTFDVSYEMIDPAGAAESAQLGFEFWEVA